MPKRRAEIREDLKHRQSEHSSRRAELVSEIDALESALTEVEAQATR